jgi:hypothetical protein
MVYRDDVPYVSAQLHGDDFVAWHPLADDGDALRLAVKLGMTLQLLNWWSCADATGATAIELTADHDTREAATRRAIVRAAAALGNSGGQA